MSLFPFYSLCRQAKLHFHIVKTSLGLCPNFTRATPELHLPLAYLHQGEALHNINTKCCISSAESCISSIAQQLYIIKLRELAYSPPPCHPERSASVVELRSSTRQSRVGSRVSNHSCVAQTSLSHRENFTWALPKLHCEATSLSQGRKLFTPHSGTSTSRKRSRVWKRCCKTAIVLL